MFEHALDVLGADDEDHADAAIEGAKHVRLTESRPLLEPSKYGRQCERAEVDLGGEAGGKHARNVVSEPTAGDMGERLDGVGSANRIKDLPDINTCRCEQSLAESHV